MTMRRRPVMEMKINKRISMPKMIMITVLKMTA
jgi:hypothetical protein